MYYLKKILGQYLFKKHSQRKLLLKCLFSTLLYCQQCHSGIFMVRALSGMSQKQWRIKKKISENQNRRGYRMKFACWSLSCRERFVIDFIQALAISFANSFPMSISILPIPRQYKSNERKIVIPMQKTTNGIYTQIDLENNTNA